MVFRISLACLVVAGAARFVAGCSSDSSTAGAPSDSGSPDSQNPDGSTNDSGATSADGGGDAGPFYCPPDTTDGAPPSPVPPVCDPTATWGAETSPGLPTSDNDVFQAITSNELSIAWIVEDFPSNTVFVADRASTADAFSAPQIVTDPVVTATEKIALSPDGLRLAAVSSDFTRIVEATRAASGDAFGASADGTFSVLNAYAVSNSVQYADCVISPDDHALYYSAYGPDPDYTLYVSTRVGTEAWPVGQPIKECELKMEGISVRSPTGVSADGLTLFYYDSARGIARAAWRPGVTSPFLTFVDLGKRFGAQPNAACNRLYDSVEQPAASGLELGVSSKQ